MINSLTTLSDWEVYRLWNCPFENYLQILRQNTERLLHEREKKILLIQSHPHCFTKGRGLRQLVDGPVLKELTSDQESKLPFPLYDINRGGGLTFHYPGQVIIYPLVNLNVFPKAMMTLMHLLLQTMGETLKELQYVKSFSLPKESYGLWSENKKIASVGMGLDHYVTQHGLALNFFYDEKMFSTIRTLSPCGIAAASYCDLETFNNTKFSFLDRENLVNSFLNNFIQKLKKA